MQKIAVVWNVIEKDQGLKIGNHSVLAILCLYWPDRKQKLIEASKMIFVRIIGEDDIDIAIGLTCPETDILKFPQFLSEYMKFKN